MVELAPGDDAEVAGLHVTATEAVHDGRRHPRGVHADAIGFVVRGSPSAYFAGDTDLFPGMADLAGSIDVALLPVAGWGPTLGPGHLDPASAAEAARRIAPGLAIPIHFGTFSLWRRVLGPRDPERPARDFAAGVARHAPEVRVEILTPGAHVEIAQRDR